MTNPNVRAMACCFFFQPVGSLLPQRGHGFASGAICALQTTHEIIDMTTLRIKLTVNHIRIMVIHVLHVWTTRIVGLKAKALYNVAITVRPSNLIKGLLKPRGPCRTPLLFSKPELQRDRGAFDVDHPGITGHFYLAKPRTFQLSLDNLKCITTTERTIGLSELDGQ